MHKKIIAVVLIASASWLCMACQKSGGATGVSSEKITVTYAESDADFANPERGFYRYTQTSASNYTPLDAAQLQQWRGLNNADGGSYQVYSTLVFRYFILDIFKNAQLSESFLQAVKKDFDIARSAGIKLIPRFTYTTSVNSGNCPEGFICPPYGDAPKEIVLQHIQQLKPLLTEAADVIAVMQLGFIGTWGEAYYTDYFGDASQNSNGKLLDNNWQDRFEVIAALLNALPKDRMVQVRYPQLKQRFVYGIAAGVTVPALLASEAFNGTNKSRIGFHNDCFLASPDDYGTYEDYGNSSSPRQSANEDLRQYFAADSKYVAVGGETCDDAYSPQNDCGPAGFAETEMAAMHYSYLNSSYNNAVNNDWQTGGCMMSIRKKLGYRFVLKELMHPKEVAVGSTLSFSFLIDNIGYAAPFNERPVKMILKNSTTHQIYTYDVATDVRKWLGANIKVEASIRLDAAMPAGSYNLYLYLPDKYASIAAKPAYAIRLANTNMWDEATGYNSLNATVTVK